MQLHDSFTDLGVSYKFKQKADFLAPLYRDQHHLLLYLTPRMANDSQAAHSQDLWLLIKVKSYKSFRKLRYQIGVRE